MFDGMLPTEFSPDAPNTSTTRQTLSYPVVIAVVLALLCAALSVALRSEPSEGFHIEFIGP